jgi:hypothetical protein
MIKNKAVLMGGEILVNVHSPVKCQARSCAVHHPSEHHMLNWRQHWRSDRGLMERICEHRVGHPDPDHISWIRLVAGDLTADAESIHGCDGCCASTE